MPKQSYCVPASDRMHEKIFFDMHLLTKDQTTEVSTRHLETFSLYRWIHTVVEMASSAAHMEKVSSLVTFITDQRTDEFLMRSVIDSHGLTKDHWAFTVSRAIEDVFLTIYNFPVFITIYDEKELDGRYSVDITSLMNRTQTFNDPSIVDKVEGYDRKYHDTEVNATCVYGSTQVNLCGHLPTGFIPMLRGDTLLRINDKGL